MQHRRRRVRRPAASAKLDAILHVRCLGIEIPLAQVYARVDFPPMLTVPE